ncbi:MAG TPA: glycosyltransferase family 2 protein [Patescibacteria group bacterium]|nr:glycosyltransferase family 2 protein [Patescibacteria group bacterium]
MEKNNKLKTLTVIIPALNEEKGIGPVIREIPIEKLEQMGYKTEVLVIDNNSTDDTSKVAKDHGATVIVMPIRGYGNAYKAGFANASGDVIATGDADLTYPFSILPEILLWMEKEDLDFINTDRLTNLNKEAMSSSHELGNYVLSFLIKVLFGWPYKDSQSGMWIFKRSIWKQLTVTSSGMPFSQELKIEAFIHGFKCAEVPIEYRTRAGKEKLNTLKDGLGNITHLFIKRLSLTKQHVSRSVMLLIGGIIGIKSKYD